MDIKEVLRLVYDALDSKRAEKIDVIDISSVSDVADYFIIASGNNKHQIKAMQDECINSLEKYKISPKNIEGRDSDSWVLLDYIDIIVHIFNENTRDYYSLDHLWDDGIKLKYNEL